MHENIYLVSAIAVMALGTAFLRFVPFVIFRQKTPRMIGYLGEVLPEAIIAMLVVYCLKNVSFIRGSHGLPEMIAMGIVIALHKWKHNTLLSILIGTVSYMLLVQRVFG